ncbi:TraR/DksA C4-type zinc finger protein [Haloactinopolyspora sp.]|uniref:TraR/DksA family transcriptional regulator n=1 Tax=Haloactinopolyspora sp. TaxID=1966353 RepID=UPI00261FA7A3|nr:TraR/DksA C4-type zinc finger protein [Haloactinopolyspora sp.]
MNPQASKPHTTIPADALARIEKELNDAEISRQRQLDELDPAEGGEVTAATVHRATVERILIEIRAAQVRLADGTFGVCERCDASIPVERLELRPWTTVCVGCADR